MERRGFLGRLIGGVVAAAGVVGLKAKSETTWLLNTDFLKYTGPNAGRYDKIFFKGVELVEDQYVPEYSYAQVHGYVPKGHDQRMLDLITDKLHEGQAVMDRIDEQYRRAQTTMAEVLSKGLFPNA